MKQSITGEIALFRLSNFLSTKIERGGSFDPQRFKNIYAFVKDKFKKPKHSIQLIGTNAKGSTGRFIACGLSDASVFHFTSPHILTINERFWLNGKIVSDEELANAHIQVFKLLNDKDKQEISYFEYCTLLAAYFAQTVDFAIFEAGMGGEFDATSALDIDLTIATPIDLDHMDILGNSIEEIALTKLKAAKNILLVGVQPNLNIVLKTLDKLSTNVTIYSYKAWLDKDDYALAGTICDALNMPKSPFVNNILLAIAAVRLLNSKPILDNFLKFDLGARAQRIGNTTLDAGHNSNAAQAIAKNFKPKSVRLVFGCAQDKDAKNILQAFTDVATHVEFLEYDSQRRISTKALTKIAKKVGLKVKPYIKDKHQETLVFGSFELIAAFLRGDNV